MLLVSKQNYRGDCYLLRAKFTNNSNFFVREVGRGSGVEALALSFSYMFSPYLS